MEPKKTNFKFKEETAVALLTKLSTVSKSDVPKEQKHGNKLKALSKITDECCLLPGLHDAPKTTVATKVDTLFRLANKSLEELSDEGVDVTQLLLSEAHNIMAYVVIGHYIVGV